MSRALATTNRNKLAFQLAWQREDADRVNRNVIGQASATGASYYLYVDPNTRLLDGRPNPYFGRPYVGVEQPVTEEQPSATTRIGIKASAARSSGRMLGSSTMRRWMAGSATGRCARARPSPRGLSVGQLSGGMLPAATDCHLRGMNPYDDMLAFTQETELPIDKLALLLAAAGALILGIKDCVMNSKSAAPHSGADSRAEPASGSKAMPPG